MNVEVTMTSRATVDGECEETTLQAVGTWERTDEAITLRYTEAEGADVCVTVRPTQAVIERHGEVHSQMLLEEGKRHLCRYETPYGRLMLHVQATRLRFAADGEGGRLQAAYTREMSGAQTQHESEITIKEVSPC